MEDWIKWTNRSPKSKLKYSTRKLKKIKSKQKKKKADKIMTEEIHGPGPDEKEIIPVLLEGEFSDIEKHPELIETGHIGTSLPNINPDIIGTVSSEEMKEKFGIKIEETIKQNPFDKIMEKLKKVLDFNKDDKIDFQDLKEFLKLFAGVLVVIYFVIFTLERDEILAMWMTGIWDFGFLYNNIVFVGISAIGAYFFNMFKKRWLETDTLMVSYKSQSEAGTKLLAEINFEHDLEIEKINHSHQLELMNKEITIRTKDELTRIEIVKADFIDEIKKLMSKKEN